MERKKVTENFEKSNLIFFPFNTFYVFTFCLGQAMQPGARTKRHLTSVLRDQCYKDSRGKAVKRLMKVVEVQMCTLKRIQSTLR